MHTPRTCARIGLLLIGCLGSWSTTEAKVVYVAKTGNDANDGLSWATAKVTVQAGLKAAVAGDEVWVAAGTYVECIGLTAEVALYGGFTGSETERSQRDWKANEAILDGGAWSAVVGSPEKATPATRIDGFTIRNGKNESGAGICCFSHTSPTIANNTITGNHATYRGGGIYCDNYSSPVIINNTIVGNDAYAPVAGSFGGGIYCNSSSSLTIVNNTISSNRAYGYGYGGGIYIYGVTPSAIIANNRITANVASGADGMGGGIFCGLELLTITNNTITGNKAVHGGGIYSAGTLSVANTIVAFNSSGICYSGSGSAAPILRSSCVFGNVTYNYSGLADPTGTDGNISSDPKLAGLPYGNVHLELDSPCKDAGDDAQTQADWRDVDGQARVQGSHVDIGADESDGVDWPAGPYVVVRVSPAGNDANDGSTWALAKRTVQAGIDRASVLGGEVWVQAGTYRERITLHPYAYLYGGFEGTESSRDQRDWRIRTTILDGQAAGTVVTVQVGERVSAIDGFTIRNGYGTVSDAYVALCGGGIYCTDSSPIITNNAITGNIACGDRHGYGGAGGGICCGPFSSPVITNNAITDNSALNPSSYAGGGIYCYYSTPTITNNTVAGNATCGTSQGGAICSGNQSAPTILNTIVAFNLSGIYATASGAPVLRYNCVYGNTAFNYSGVADPTGTDGNISADPKLAQAAYGNVHILPDSPCRDAGDDTQVEADGEDIDGQARIQDTHVDIGADESDGSVQPAGPYVIVRVSPNGNDANDGSSWASAKRTVQAGIDLAGALGGEVWVQAGVYRERIILHPYAYVYGGFAGTEDSRGQRNRTTQACILDGQAAGSVVSVVAGDRASALDGFTIRNGSASNGGGIYCWCASPAITNNTVTGSSASYGGGVYCIYSSPRIVNNTIVGNSAPSGGGICCDSSSPTIANTIVAFNTSGIRKVSNPAKPILRYNCVFGNGTSNYFGLTDPTGTNGNISADPKLAEIACGNVHIQPSSPCKNAGEDAQVQTDWRDIDGQARIQDNHVDIGADESDETVHSAGPYVIVRVSPTGDDANDGSSWLSAKRTVQAAIDLASILGGEVWVRAGTYQERIILHPYAHVYGGFAGTETSRDQRDWRTQTTILDGDAAGSVVTVVAGERVSTINGFTIRNGNADYGGGIHCSYPSPTIANNTITANRATTFGGGIYCDKGAPTITNNAITHNSVSHDGGGIYCAASSSPVITNNTITSNSSSGIHCYQGSRPTITNNTIMGSDYGIFCLTVSTIVNNTIVGNAYGIYGSGTLKISNTIVAFNTSGIQCPSTSVLRFNCVYGNTEYNYGSGLTDPTGTAGNISADPKLVDVSYGNAHIQPNSPCRDAGDRTPIQADWQDIDGQPRIQGDRVDIGADESDGTVWTTGPYVIVRTSPSGDDANDGSSWALAKRTVQAAIDLAGTLGGEVWVQAGTYQERIVLQQYVHMYGGFAGTEDSRDRRDWQAQPTILDGQAAGSVVVVSPGERLNTLDGFTIRNGVAARGSGVNCSSSSPTIANTTITGNNASNAGGGIYCGSNSSPTITNTTITGNSASTAGGGIYCGSNSSPTITNTTITGNNASSAGGGIYCDSNSSPTITNTTITGNNASSAGGGIWCYPSSSPTIANTAIAFNSSGIYQSSSSGTPILRYNCVYGNTAYDYSGLTDPTGTDGNISADPKLTGASYGDVHIQSDSPCRDAGDDAQVQPDERDLDGQARIQGAHVDIGADESDGTTWPAGPHVIVRVSPDGDNANDGSSWASAKRTVQAGIDSARVLGGEVWVQAGVYEERITLHPYAHVYGGFAGTEDSRDHRDWRAQPTILDGQAAGSVVTVRAGARVSTIDGFTIRNGKASSGGGIYCYASPTIANTTITGNNATFGGGIYCSSSPTIANTTITGNNAADRGGGIYCCYFSSPTIANTTITGNNADEGGGIYCYSSSPAITNTTITGNNASIAGGICCESSSPTIANTTITGNNASSTGGGIYCSYSSSPTIANTAITGNNATNAGGIYCGSQSSPTIVHTTITRNNASSAGGGICCSNSSPPITNTIIAFNSSGIYKTGSGTPILRYSCVYGNMAYNYSGLTDPTGTDGNLSVDPLFVRSPNAGTDEAWATADDDPGDLHLKAGSPCIDAGDNGALPAGVLTDLDGFLRFVDDPTTADTGLGTAPIVDMGAYEYIPGDFDHDGDIDTDDLNTFAACVSGPAVPCSGGCAKADFDKDGDVDQSDFGFIQRWFSGAGKADNPA